MSEFIYVLENPSMPGLVKIGRTERSVSERLTELSSHTGVPTGFSVVKEYAVSNSVEAERIVHERLSVYRVAVNREFFKIEPEDATDIIESILGPEKPEQRDFDREDELVARAIPIVAELGTARPRMLEEMLGISYEEALCVIHVLRGRGVIDERNVS
ncbi:MAG: GIY-YIG nuclease family protein, partial [Verrucomicrobia bacterium]|nr:GIY-YIG nuclease family protein [Verrucomicrobiota bacterium]